MNVELGWENLGDFKNLLTGIQLNKKTTYHFYRIENALPYITFMIIKSFKSSS